MVNLIKFILLFAIVGISNFLQGKFHAWLAGQVIPSWLNHGRCSTTSGPVGTLSHLKSHNKTYPSSFGWCRWWGMYGNIGLVIGSENNSFSMKNNLINEYACSADRECIMSRWPLTPGFLSHSLGIIDSSFLNAFIPLRANTRHGSENMKVMKIWCEKTKTHFNASFKTIGAGKK